MLILAPSTQPRAPRTVPSNEAVLWPRNMFVTPFQIVNMNCQQRPKHASISWPFVQARRRTGKTSGTGGAKRLGTSNWSSRDPSTSQKVIAYTVMLVWRVQLPCEKVLYLESTQISPSCSFCERRGPGKKNLLNGTQQEQSCNEAYMGYKLGAHVFNIVSYSVVFQYVAYT